jgi:hypothetical protein
VNRKSSVCKRQGLSFREVAAAVGCHPETIRRAWRAGRIPSFRVPGSGNRGVIRIPAEWIRNKFGVEVE